MPATRLSFCLIISLFLTGSVLFASDLRVHFLAVGHGDAILLEWNGQGLALVDGGPPEAGPTILHYLDSLGIHRLEHLFITHPHDDHIGGIPLVLDSLQVGIIHLTGWRENTPVALRLDQYLQSGNWPLDTLSQGDQSVNLPDLSIEVLSLPKDYSLNPEASMNHRSLVLLIKHGHVKILLPADIDAEREKWLIQHNNSDLRCQVLKATHHGAEDGNSEEFLKTVAPQFIVVSVGPSPWHYPSEKTLQRLRQFCPTVLRTDEVGTVVLQSNGEAVEIITPKETEP